MFPVDYFTTAFVTLLVIIDPIALAPIFLGVTAGMNAEQRRQVSFRACIIAFAILGSVAFIGDWLLGKLGISLPAFRIAGGLLLFWISFEMVFGGRTQRRGDQAQAAITKDHVKQIAAFPLAIPLMAGPGAITAVILLAGQADGRPIYLGVLVGVLAIVILLSLAVYLAAERIDKLLGTTGNVVLSRVLGIILAALAVQFVIDGIRAVIAATPK
jgi:multiple antibiotic resistance protein